MSKCSERGYCDCKTPAELMEKKLRTEIASLTSKLSLAVTALEGADELRELAEDIGWHQRLYEESKGKDNIRSAKEVVDVKRVDADAIESTIATALKTLRGEK